MMLFFCTLTPSSLCLSVVWVTSIIIKNHILKRKKDARARQNRASRRWAATTTERHGVATGTRGRLPFSTFSSLSLSLFILLLQQVKLYSPPTNSISFVFRHVSSLTTNDNRQPERIFTSSCGCPSPWGLFYSTSGF